MTDAVTFDGTLAAHGLTLRRAETTTLQVNVGLNCDLACRHCHQTAGSGRNEQMTEEVIDQIIACARRFSFSTIDITGGAPELHPELPRLLTGVADSAPTLIVRTNLTALARPESAHLPELYRQHRVTIAASLPSLNRQQNDAQRGEGAWDASLEMLRHLNRIGYGQPGSGLELLLVSNPAGAFLPPGQSSTENRFHAELERRYGIRFNHLLTLTNVPLGRFRSWLEESGNLPCYMDKLRASFNPSAVDGLMCRSFVSVDWNGNLFDCDFNLAASLPLGGSPMHISNLTTLPAPGSPVSTGMHCFACTAGAGFTCGGSIT